MAAADHRTSASGSSAGNLGLRSNKAPHSSVKAISGVCKDSRRSSSSRPPVLSSFCIPRINQPIPSSCSSGKDFASQYILAYDIHVFACCGKASKSHSFSSAIASAGFPCCAKLHASSGSCLFRAGSLETGNAGGVVLGLNGEASASRTKNSDGNGSPCGTSLALESTTGSAGEALRSCSECSSLSF